MGHATVRGKIDRLEREGPWLPSNFVAHEEGISGRSKWLITGLETGQGFENSVAQTQLPTFPST